MIILSDVYGEITKCPSVPPETGGILGIKGNVICTSFFDNTSPQNNSAIYTPNVVLLNTKISEWEKNDIKFGGFFHSHPANQPTLSVDDIEYIKIIFRVMPTTIKSLFFPIVLPNVKLVSFKAVRQKGTIQIHEDIIKII